MLFVKEIIKLFILSYFCFQSLKPQYPQYPNLNVQIKGYDYPILESYQRYLHNVAEYLDIDVADW